MSRQIDWFVRMLTYQLVQSEEFISIPSHLGKYRCVLLIERPVRDEFRYEVSRLLVQNGCLYAIAWGKDCSLWDDSVDYANIEKFKPDDIPADHFVMTTWHETDSLEEVLRFAKFDAVVSYANEPLLNLLILDFTNENRRPFIEEIYNEAT